MLGEKGELLARDYLMSKGVEIECHNYRTRYGEIDIIGWDKDILVFYEVRTLTGSGFLPHAILSITPRKLMRLRRLASQYMLERFGRDINCRIDIVSVTGRSGYLSIDSVTPIS